MKKNEIVIGTRGSALARTQTGMVAEDITRLTSIPTKIVIIKTEGDRIQDVPLHMVDGKGFFTKELEEALLGQRIDLAVHSLKDLPIESPPGLTIAAIPSREMANDLLLVREDVVDKANPYLLPVNPVIGTSSKRRALQIKALHPSARIKELRGNVPTRVTKLVNGQYDAILVAAAGFRRLGLSAQGYRVIILGFDAMLPAPGQGALALQVRSEDSTLLGLLAGLHDENTAKAVEAERNALGLLGGGCGMPLGIYAECDGKGLSMQALLGPDDWQLQDAPKFMRGRASGDTPLETARHTVEALGINLGG
ncbi:MAG TPA: hydroxymethylbilane synthase [Candidatus Hydrogenedentes bacterium]|nr:hydroxymethylbilane synthase [Candidatus Hydrogenedentota bacterium]